jgi:hypothetical protein
MTINELIAENYKRAYEIGALAERRRAIAIAQKLGTSCECNDSIELGDSLFVDDFISYINDDEE